MSDTLLILDVNYLAYRAYFVFGKTLYHKGQPTGVTFGILRDIRALTEQFNTSQIAFCFDYGKSKRVEMYPGYKLKRRREKQDPEGKTRALAMRAEMDFIRKELLSDLSMNNVFFQDGYEADDLIAATVKASQFDTNVVVSNDHDLYQLLSPNTIVWKPTQKTVYLKKDFIKEFGVLPNIWHKIKAVAGCSTDEIPGAKGVGESKAAKYFAGKMNDGIIKDRITNFIKSETYQMNKRLVRLPLDGTHEVEIDEQPPINHARWIEIAKRLGMKSLVPR